MALDTLDYSVLLALAIALVAYLTKGSVWGGQKPKESSNKPTKTRCIREALEINDKSCVVFYGSQTGTAEDYAYKLGKELQARFGMKSIVADLNDYDFDSLNELQENSVVFFLMATYGEGEPTDNAIEFMEYLDNEADDLSNLKFGVFGLGNSTYEFFDAIGKKTNDKLLEVGATRLGEFGEGDDGRGTMDEDFLSWKDSLFEILKEKLVIEEHDLVYEASLRLIELHDDSNKDLKVALGEPNEKYLNGSLDDLKFGPFDHSHPYLAPITATKELFNSNKRSCVHVEFDLSNTNLRYSTGDHLALWPSNSNEKVLKFLQAFNLEEKKDEVFTVEKIDPTSSISFPTPTTYETVVRYFLEISGPVSRQTFLSIANFAPNEVAKSEVKRLANDKIAFANEVHSKNLNLADALLLISLNEPWGSVPFSFIIESINHLQPRYYSISSSSSHEKTSIHITAVVESEVINNVEVSGVATNLLKNIELSQNKKSISSSSNTYNLSGPRNKFSNHKLPIHIRKSTFKLPTNPATPIILIGPGTGVAPFRGFIREKIQYLSNTPNNNNKIGKILLFYGCRSSTEDFLYKEEWPEYSSKLGSSFELITAFSREDPNKKTYVQDKLLERSAEINELLNQGAFIYVCGDASKMARDVQKTITNILVNERKLSETVAVDMVRNFKVQNRYQEDVW